MNIPICPVCKEPTKRMQGVSFVTAMYFPVIYDEQGKRVDTGSNTTSTTWKCLDCGNEWTVEE